MAGKKSKHFFCGIHDKQWMRRASNYSTNPQNQSHSARKARVYLNLKSPTLPSHPKPTSGPSQYIDNILLAWEFPLQRKDVEKPSYRYHGNPFTWKDCFDFETGYRFSPRRSTRPQWGVLVYWPLNIWCWTSCCVTQSWADHCIAHTCQTYRDHFVYAPSQWEATLQCNVVSHWLGACTEWSLGIKTRLNDIKQ